MFNYYFAEGTSYHTQIDSIDSTTYKLHCPVQDKYKISLFLIYPNSHAVMYQSSENMKLKNL